MKAKSYILMLYVFCFCGIIMGQNTLPHPSMKCEGLIPKDFITASSRKYEAASREMSKEGSKLDRKSRNNFLLSSNFLLDDFLVSGMVMFGDPVTNYLNDVKDKVLADNEKLRNIIRIYTVRSSAVNAFATNDGIIFVNIGLIAHIRNEAELAYILCHEIQHYVCKHAIKGYVEAERMKEGVGSYSILAQEQMMVTRNRYSRKQEDEADRKGLDLFLKTGYSTDSISRVYDVLRYSYLPFENAVFDPEYLQTAFVSAELFPVLDSVKPVSGSEDFDSTLSTHPSIASRETVMKEKIGTGKPGEGNLVGSWKFSQVVWAARAELNWIYLRNCDYGNAMYNSWLLSRKYPETYKDTRTVLHSLYAVAKYANRGQLSEVLSSWEDIEGNSQSVFYMLHNLDNYKLTILALSKAWEAFKKTGNDYEKDVLFDLLMEYYKFHSGEVSEEESGKALTISITHTAGEGESGEETEKEPADSLSMARIPFKQAFEKMMEKEVFSMMYAGARDSVNAAIERRKLSEDMNYMKERGRFRKKYGMALGIDSLVFIEPSYTRIDHRKEVPVEYIASEGALEEFTAMIRENSHRLAMKNRIITTAKLNETNLDEFNSISAFSIWLREFAAHSDFYMVSPFREDLLWLKQQYGTSHFAFASNSVIRYKRGVGPVLFALYCCIPLVTIPLAARYIVVPDYKNHIFFAVLNIETQKVEGYFERTIRFRDRSDVLNSVIYEILAGIKHDPK